METRSLTGAPENLPKPSSSVSTSTASESGVKTTE